jgi:hypothetical protein
MGGGSGGGGSPPPPPDPYAEERRQQAIAREKYEKERQEIYIPRTNAMLAQKDIEMNNFYNLIEQYYKDTNQYRNTPVTEYTKKPAV